MRNLQKALAKHEFTKATAQQVMQRNQNLARIALDERAKVQRLARLLACIVMKTGGRFVIADDDLAQVPDDAKLTEEREEEKRLTVLMTVAPKEQGSSPIEIATPQIEVVPR